MTSGGRRLQFRRSGQAETCENRRFTILNWFPASVLSVLDARVYALEADSDRVDQNSDIGLHYRAFMIYLTQIGQKKLWMRFEFDLVPSELVDPPGTANDICRCLLVRRIRVKHGRSMRLSRVRASHDLIGMKVALISSSLSSSSSTMFDLTRTVFPALMPAVHWCKFFSLRPTSSSPMDGYTVFSSREFPFPEFS